MIKFVFRWAFRLLMLAIALVIAVVLLKDTVARSLAEERIRRETGFDAKIGGLQLNLFAPKIQLERVVLYNPAEFGGSVFLDVPEMHVEYDRPKLALGKLHLKLLRLNVRELHIVESASGRTNILDILHKVAPEMLGGPQNPSQKYRFTGVDMLNLSIEKVRYSDLRLPKRNQEVNLSLRNDLTRNLRSEQDFGAVLFKILLRAGITIYAEQKHGGKHLRSQGGALPDSNLVAVRPSEGEASPFGGARTQ